MSEESDRARLRKATGPNRPSYLDSSDVDRVMSVLLALVSEVAAIRERLDTHEQLGNAGALTSSKEVEGYAASATVEVARDEWRDAYIKRLFRVITEDIEALSATQPPLDRQSD